MIGACGWQHPGWLETFYPGDLPDEWKLGYYGNEYSVVLIPASYWQQADVSVQEWLDETDNSPAFVSEWPATAAAQQVARKGMTLLGARGLGFVIELTQIPVNAEVESYQALQANYALSFDIAGLTEQGQKEVLLLLNQTMGESNFGVCWHGEPGKENCLALGQLGLTRISSVSNPKDLRRILESIIAHSQPHRKQVLMVDGQPPDIHLIENAGIILDLL